MSWVSIAVLSAIVLGAVNIIDSHLLSKRMPGLLAFMLPVAILHLVYSGILCALFPLPEGTGIWPIMVTIASGVLRTAAVIIMLYSLKSEEVSRVIPITYTYPIFVAIMAAPLLGESLYFLEWLAVIMVVAGAVIVSLKQSSSGSTIWQGKLLLFLSTASLLFALANIASKYALQYISFWNMFWISAFSMSAIFLAASARPHIFRQLIAIKPRGSVAGLLALDETLASIGIVLMFWALEMGPVSLVATIASSQPMFVVIFAFALSRILPMFLEWHPGRGMLVLRLVATVMIVGGIAIIYLT
ncbi:MAG: DMT family transporter [Dehalococcoidia bacterium]|nr:MAG: DMT family transporter [Dehalococcoidia bacterium]